MGWCSRLAARLRPAAMLASLAGMVVLALGLAPPAVAAPRSASGGPGVNPLGSPGNSASPRWASAHRFQLAIAPGHAITAEFIVASWPAAQTLTLGHATGITAGNAAVPTCRPAAMLRTGCWVTTCRAASAGPRAKSVCHLSGASPPGTRPGQYLTGIAAGSATESARCRLAPTAWSGALAVIDNTVTLGVAVTVGNLPDLVSRLSVMA